MSVAVMGTMQKGSLYCYDMWSDINVVQELEENVQNFKMPNFVEVDNIEQKITDFVLKKVQTSAVPAMKEPCELLDLIEDFADDAIPFYGNVVTKIAQVRWNPNRKSKFHISDVFRIIQHLLEVYSNVTDLASSSKIGILLPTEYPQLLKNLTSALEKINSELSYANSGFTGFLARELWLMCHRMSHLLREGLKY